MNWAQVQANALPISRLTALSDLSAVLVLVMSAKYRNRRHWDYNGEYVTVAQWDEIQAAMSELEDTVMKGLIGAVIPHVLADLSDYEALDCDGSSYLRADYPELYARIHPDLIIDADNFRVPDLNGRFPRGVGGAEIVGDTGGADEITLDESEIPSHTHTNAPHNHSEITSTPFPTLVGAGAPAVYAVSGVGATGLSSISIDNTGGGQPHENRPQFTNIRWLIVAG